MKVVLQDCANASVSGTVPSARSCAFLNWRPSTDVVPGHGTGVSGVSTPADSSAVDVITFMLEPGGKRPLRALPGSAAWLEDTARISPVPGRTTTTWVGSFCVAAAASAAFCTAGTSGVCSGVPATGSTEPITWPSSPVPPSARTTETVKPGVPASCSWKARCRPDRPSWSPAA